MNLQHVKTIIYFDVYIRSQIWLIINNFDHFLTSCLADRQGHQSRMQTYFIYMKLIYKNYGANIDLINVIPV